MKKYFKISLVILSILISTSSQCSQKPPSTKKTGSHQYFIKVFNKSFPVSKKVIKQFENYEAEKRMKEKLKTKIKTKGGKTIWNITNYINENLKPKEKDKKLIIELIGLLLDIASDKISPYEVENKLTIFMIIKTADLLGHKLESKAFKKLKLALVGKVVGKPIRIYPIQLDFSCNLPINFQYPKNDRATLFIPDRETTSIYLIDTKTGKILKEFKGSPDDGLAYAIKTFKKEKFFLGGYNSQFILWDTETCKKIKTIKIPPPFKFKKPYSIILTDDEKKFFSFNRFPTRGVLIDIENRKVLKTFKKIFEKDIVDKKNIFIYLRTGKVEGYSLQDGKRLKTFKIPKKPPYPIVRDKKTKEELTYTIKKINEEMAWIHLYDGPIQLWNLHNQKRLKTFGLNKKIQEFRVINKGKNLLALTKLGQIIVWDIKTREELQKINIKDLNPSLGIINDGQEFVIRNKNGRHSIWHTKTGKKIIAFNLPQNIESCVPEQYPYKYSNLNSLFIDSGQKLLVFSFNQCKLFDLNPYANLTFKQIELIYDIFTSNDPLKIKQFSDEHETITNLPRSIENEIKKQKLIEIEPINFRKLITKAWKTNGEDITAFAKAKEALAKAKRFKIMNLEKTIEELDNAITYSNKKLTKTLENILSPREITETKEAIKIYSYHKKKYTNKIEFIKNKYKYDIYKLDTLKDDLPVVKIFINNIDLFNKKYDLPKLKKSLKNIKKLIELSKKYIHINKKGIEQLKKQKTKNKKQKDLTETVIKKISNAIKTQKQRLERLQNSLDKANKLISK